MRSITAKLIQSFKNYLNEEEKSQATKADIACTLPHSLHERKILMMIKTVGRQTLFVNFCLTND